VTAAIIIPTLDGCSEMAQACLRALDDTAVDAKVWVEHDIDGNGFGFTCNEAARQWTDADVLVFLNDDTIPQPGWLDPLLAVVDDDTIAGSLLLYPDGRVQHSGVFLRRRQGLLEAYNRTRPAPSGEVPAVTGACLAVTRNTWEALGGFDEGYRNGYEDVDLCLRHRQAGGTVRYVAESVVVHLESQSDPALRFGHARQNIDLLQQRWGDLPI